MRDIARGDAVSLTRALVGIDSRNPSLAPDAAGEGAVAEFLGDVLGRWGAEVDVREVLPGRPNVIARLGSSGGRSLMLNGHLDVVGVEGMVHPPFSPEPTGSRIHGRGATDMKAGVAAMCAAAARVHARGELKGEVVIAAVADEEFESAGTRALVASGIRTDAAIVTEPTRLAICPAHRGFVWMEVEVKGRAAHGSRYELGVDAIRNAGLLLAELEEVERGFDRVQHPLLGRASLHASTIEGGNGWSTYPEHCRLTIERRTLPGERVDDCVREVEDACIRAGARRADFDADVRFVFAQPPCEVAADAAIVQSLSNAIRACGRDVRIEGMSAWTDAALLSEAGIPAICFGPGDIALAHAAAEWVDVDEIEAATEILERFILEWCG